MDDDKKCTVHAYLQHVHHLVDEEMHDRLGHQILRSTIQHIHAGMLASNNRDRQRDVYVIRLTRVTVSKYVVRTISTTAYVAICNIFHTVHNTLSDDVIHCSGYGRLSKGGKKIQSQVCTALLTNSRPKGNNTWKKATEDLVIAGPERKKVNSSNLQTITQKRVPYVHLPRNMGLFPPSL